MRWLCLITINMHVSTNGEGLLDFNSARRSLESRPRVKSDLAAKSTLMTAELQAKGCNNGRSIIDVTASTMGIA